MILVCPKCGYRWDFKGSNNRPTCPNCMGKLPSFKRKCPNLSVEERVDQLLKEKRGV